MNKKKGKWVQTTPEKFLGLEGKGVEILKSIQERIKKIPAIKYQDDPQQIDPFDSDAFCHGISLAIKELEQHKKDRELLEEAVTVLQKIELVLLAHNYRKGTLDLLILFNAKIKQHLGEK